MTSKLLGTVAMIGALTIAMPALAQNSINSSNSGMANPPVNTTPPPLGNQTTINDRIIPRDETPSQRSMSSPSADPNIQPASVTPQSTPPASMPSVTPVSSTSGDKMGRPNAREFAEEQRITAELNRQQQER